MKLQPEISVIVPVYKCEEYIHRCVNSILNQTFKDFELILIDDGSPDRSGELCNEIAKKDGRIRVIHQENGGQASARNQGVKAARGEWLHFVDCDDAIHPQMLEKLYWAVKSNGVKMSICGAYQGEELPKSFSSLFSESSEKILTMNEKNILHLCKDLKYYYWVVWGKLLHKSIYEKHPLTEGRIYEDNAVVCKWLHEAGKTALLNQEMYFYYTNTSSTTKNSFSEKQLDVLWAFREQIEFFDSLGYKKMLSHLCTYYFEISANLCRRIKTENGNKKLISTVKNNETYIKNAYHEYINLSYEQQLYYYERTNKPMFYITRLKKKLGLLK